MENSSPKIGVAQGFAHGSVEDVVPLDAAYLAKSTFGDDALKGEIVALYRKQLTQARGMIASAITASDWRFVMHTLKGASTAVGAMQFAFLADEWARTVFPSEGQRQIILNDFDLAKAAFMNATQKL